jgi:hypothetical protein
MYRVWLLVRMWGSSAGLEEAEQILAEEYALQHDLPGIRTGDTPTPHKTPELKSHLSRVEAVICPELTALQEQLTPRIRDFVKFCDTAESVLFLSVNGLGTHAQSVCDLLESQLMDRLANSSIDASYRLALIHQFTTAKADT